MHQQFEMFFREHQADVRRFAARLVGLSAADDVVSATFELALRKLPDQHPHPVGWLFRAADNLCRAELRIRACEGRAHLDAAVVADSRSERLDDVDILRHVLDRLPDGHRAVLQLTYWDRLAAADVAVVLGCSERAVWKRVSRAKAALRAAWPTDAELDSWEGLVSSAT